MRILFWSEQFWPSIGGVEVISARLLASIVDRGHEVSVVTSNGQNMLPAIDEHRGMRIHRLPFHEALVDRDIESFLECRSSVTRIKKAFQADVVHIGLVSPSVIFHLQTLKTAPCPTLATQQGAWRDLSAGPETIYGKMLATADWIACCSKSMLDGTLRRMPDVASRTSIIYNGAETPAVDPVPIRVVPPRIVALGRLVDDKGFDLAIEAMARIAERRPDARLVLAGDGPEKPRLVALATELGIAEHVEFRGWVPPDEVPALLNAASLVLVPSRVEAFGLVALEAALMARPVVGFATGGLPEVVEDGVTGLLVPEGDINALADAAVALLDDPPRLDAIRHAARERAQERFTWDHHVDEYETLYRRLVGNRQLSTGGTSEC